MVPVLAAQPGVVAVRPVIDYTISDISETVSYIGATAVQNLGVTGKGVRVAVLDTGIDYTHRDLGGSGTAADYTAAFGTSLDDPRNKTINPALFPTKKVVGGYDFVGEHWPNGPLAPDPQQHGCGPTKSAAVSFGYAALTDRADFRNPSKPAVAAVQMDLPHFVHVPARGQEDFDVRIKVDPSKLQAWTLNGGSQGGNGQLLTQLELDGQITLSDNKDTIRLPWHLLPHKAAAVEAQDNEVELEHGSGALKLRNEGATNGRVEVFAWTGTSKKIPNSQLPKPGNAFAIINLHNVGVRLANSGLGPVVQFGIHTFDARSHPNYPAEFDILIDSHNTGTPDFVVFNLENGGFGATGQNVTEVFNLVTNTPVGIFFFTDADLNSSNAILTAPLSAVELTATSQFHFSVLAFDNYFTGNLTDSIENMVFSFAQPRFVASGIPSTGVPVNGSAVLTVNSVPGGDTASPSQTGLLLLYRDAAANHEAQPIRVQSGNDNNNNGGNH